GRDSVGQIDEIEAVVSRPFGEKLMSQAVLSPFVTEIFDELSGFESRSSRFYTVSVPGELVGRTFQDAQLFFLDCDDEPIVLIGIDRSLQHLPSTRFWICPQDSASELSRTERVLRADDRLVVIASERPSYVEVTQEDLWSGRVLSRS
ncbi:hypothetical protein ACFL59_15080, partial [Planctomycetota bacterium]